MARKKKAEAHGGAWKVAYADFVTAMMALFMVLWISAQDKKILLATSRYFQNPFNSPLEKSSGVMEFNSDKASQGGSRDDAQGGSSKPQTSPKEIDLQFLNSVAKDFYRLLNLQEDLADKPIDIQVTSDGLRITLFDRARKPLFKGNTSEFTEWGRFVMQNLAWIIDRYKFKVVIEGYTKSGLSFTRKDYSDWDLSTDRANASRRALTYYAVDPRFVERVTGYGDTRPVQGEPSSSDSNQRVAISLSPSPISWHRSTADVDTFNTAKKSATNSTATATP
ncbi:motility protein B [mine drainage metagenome]|uniref:Motility protein B n=1 Tax=mine drainage metagenome TaxID=410659 RepID=A0A1J5TCZ0_9ZZZZ